MSAGPIPDRERLAAEHVVGLLEGEERREAERLLDTDPGFQAAVEQWQARLIEIDETAPPAEASDALWSRIEAGLEQEASRPQAQAHTPAIIPSPVTAFAALWRSLAFWRIAGISAAVATVLLSVGVGVLATRAAREPVLIAVLLTGENRPAAIVNAFANGRAELRPLEGLQVPPGRALQVWAILGANQNPIPVGLVNQPRSLLLDLERVPQLRPDQVFAISVEPPEGSPTGLPTGPVILQGRTSTAL